MAQGKRVTAELGVLIKANNKLSGQVQKARKDVSVFQKQLKGLGSTIIATFAVGSIINFGRIAVKAFDVQAKAQAKLLTALKGREEIQKRLIIQARQLQKRTLFGDEATIEAQAFLATMQLSEEAIKRLTPLVQDLATKMNSDLRSAADLIAKSVGSSTNALTRYGITIEGAVGSTERLESAIAALNLQVGGQAEAAALVGAGQLQQLQNQFDDFTEDIGSVIVPTLVALFKTLKISVSPAAVLADELERGLATIVKLKTNTIALGPQPLPTILPPPGLIKEAVPLLKGLTDQITKLTKARNLAVSRDQIARLNDRIKLLNQEKQELLAISFTMAQIRGMGTEEVSPIGGAKVQKPEENIKTLNQELAGLLKVLDKVNERQEKMKAKAGELRKAMDASEATAEFQKFADVALITGEVITGFVASATQGFKGLILALAGVIQKVLALAIAQAIAAESRKGLIGLVTASVAVAGFIALIQSSQKKVKGFASGVQNFSGGLALVGERGPELAQFPPGTNIIPNNKIGNMGGNITINFNGLVTDEQAVAQEITNILRRHNFNTGR